MEPSHACPPTINYADRQTACILVQIQAECVQCIARAVFDYRHEDKQALGRAGADMNSTIAVASPSDNPPVWSDAPSDRTTPPSLAELIREAAANLAVMVVCATAAEASEAQSRFERLAELAEQVRPMERFCDEIAQDCAEQERLDAAADIRRAAIATGRVVDLAQRRLACRTWPFQGGAA